MDAGELRVWPKATGPSEHHDLFVDPLDFEVRLARKGIPITVWIAAVTGERSCLGPPGRSDDAPIGIVRLERRQRRLEARVPVRRQVHILVDHRDQLMAGLRKTGSHRLGKIAVLKVRRVLDEDQLIEGIVDAGRTQDIVQVLVREHDDDKAHRARRGRRAAQFLRELQTSFPVLSI